MAKDKTSFVLYSDTLSMVSKLPDEKAGQLFKIILDYVNDKNPVVDDLLLQVAFEPIKNHLKRDLKKWEKYINKQSVNGKKGGRPPVEKESQKTQAFFKKPKKADSVIVSVSDSVNESVIVIKEHKKTQIPPIEDFLNYCQSFLNGQFPAYEFSLTAKYEAWAAVGWKDGYGKPIQNWKTKIKNTVPYLKPQKIESGNKVTDTLNAYDQAAKNMGL